MWQRKVPHFVALFSWSTRFLAILSYMKKRIDQSYLRQWLQTKFTESCRKNPNFSLRAFARTIEMDASSLSQLMAGKRRISAKCISHICQKLGAIPSEESQFLAEASRKESSPLLEVKTTQNYVMMDDDVFACIANWYHHAIVELTFIEDLKEDPKAIAQQLSIKVMEAKIAIDRLKRLGLIIEQDGFLKKAHKLTTNFTPGYTSRANRELQKQILSQGLLAIDNCQQLEKDITSMTMAIDIDKLPKARELITKFRRDPCAFLEEGQPKRVYQLGIQLFPVSNNIKEKT